MRDRGTGSKDGSRTSGLTWARDVNRGQRHEAYNKAHGTGEDGTKRAKEGKKERRRREEKRKRKRKKRKRRGDEDERLKRGGLGLARPG